MKELSNDFKGIQKENDAAYLDSVKVAVYYGDPECEISYKKTAIGMTFIINPSQPDFRQETINAILGMHKILNVKPIFSKSTKISKKIIFSVEFI